jgi:transposase
MTAAQVRDWLEENYKLDAAERTVRHFVSQIREEYGISKQSEPQRDYEAVEELPMGYQMQLDFGQKNIFDVYRNRYITLYFVVFTLSHSRYKWGIFQDRPFMSIDLVRALYGCFDYFGGMPRQLVYDQDSIIVVSENGGDIIHTQALSAFLAESKLEVRVCRKSDPESKGLIEASVKFVKGNFMQNRKYTGIEAWNQSFEKWLVRTGNKKEHGTIKRRPVDAFTEEQEHLLPLYGVAPAEVAEEMSRTVRPDNTVWYSMNRYAVPLGTYSKTKEVLLAIEGDKLFITDRLGQLIDTHDICYDKGRLIKFERHRRKKSDKIITLLENTTALLGDEFSGYLGIISEEKPRYVKEQFDIVLNACKTFGRETVLEAMLYCQSLELYSANDLYNASEMINCNAPMQEQPNRLPVEDERYHIPVQARPLSVYADVAAGIGVSQ